MKEREDWVLFIIISDFFFLIKSIGIGGTPTFCLLAYVGFLSFSLFQIVLALQSKFFFFFFHFRTINIMYGGGANQTTTTNRQFIMTHHSLTHFKVSPSDAKKKFICMDIVAPRIIYVMLLKILNFKCSNAINCFEMSITWH